MVGGITFLQPHNGPLMYYVLTGIFYGAGIALLGWRVNRRFGLKGLILFILLFGVYGVIRDFTVSVVPIQQFNSVCSRHDTHACRWTKLDNHHSNSTTGNVGYCRPSQADKLRQ
jgi:hypothetical protein